MGVTSSEKTWFIVWFETVALIGLWFFLDYFDSLGLEWFRRGWFVGLAGDESENSQDSSLMVRLLGASGLDFEWPFSGGVYFLRVFLWEFSTIF